MQTLLPRRPDHSLIAWLLFAWIPVLSTVGSAGAAAAFDFGTAAGNVTPVAAGFSQAQTGAGAFVDQPNGLELIAADGSFENFAFTRIFSGLGGGKTSDFTLSTEVRVNELIGSGQENNDRWGLLLLGQAGDIAGSNQGIAAIVVARGNTGGGTPETAQLMLRDGVNGTVLATADWVGGAITQGVALRLKIVGTYAGPAALELVFTVSRLDDSDTQSISTVVTGPVLGGDQFGGILRIKSGRAIEFDGFAVAVANEEDPVDPEDPNLPPVPANLVVEGPDGLAYSPYANQGQTNAVHTVPDFSRAGYRGGGVPIPFVPAVVVLEPEPGDNHARIQNAINAVAAMPVGADGFRGAILLRAGDYHVSETLTVSSSGIVIRGEGSQQPGGTRIIHTATSQSDLFHFHGSASPASVSGTLRPITDALVPVGSRILNVTDGSAFDPGDLIRVTNTVNQQWIDAIGMNLVDPAWTPSGFHLEFLRYVTAVDGNKITLDAPVVQAIEAQYGGGTIERLTFAGAIRNIGIESLRLESVFGGNTDESHGWRAIEMRRVVDGWVRQVTARYFGYGAVDIQQSSHFITVEDSAMLDPVSQTTGGRKYSFNVNDSNYVLMQRNLTRGGRHDFVTGSRTPGPNAFVDGLATQANSDIGPHFRYATGQIYENIKSNNTIRVQNRFNSGTSHGWAGAQVMFWNVEAGGIVCDAPVGGMNWSVGAVGAKQEGAWVPSDPDGIWESPNARVQPRSLFYAQLRDRLGAAAVRRTTLPEQLSGPIWNALLAWDGNGLFGQPLVAGVNGDAASAIDTPLPLLGIVRDLRMLDDLSAVSWTLVSGPGTPAFANASALETTATFAVPGSYLLELSVTGAGITETDRILVQALAPEPDEAPPAAPAFFTVSYANGEASLAWQASPEADVVSYNIYRSLVPVAGALPIRTAHAATNFSDSDVVDGLRYYYAVTAVDADGNESPRSNELFITAIESVDPPALSVPAIDSAYVRAGQGVLDSSQWLGIKRFDFTGTARAAFLRFPLSGPGLLGGTDPDEIETVSLTVEVTQNEPTDTIRIYGLLNNAQASAGHLSELTWTGGSNGTAGGGKNLSSANRPDGGGSLPNAYSTVELGSFTFAGPVDSAKNNDTGLHAFEITNLEAFRQLIRDDTNGEITLLLRGQRDGEFNQIASTFNTNGHSVPTLVLTVADPDVFEDANNNRINDAWEMAKFSRLLGTDEIIHPSGVPYYFMYLHGAEPSQPAERFQISAEPDLQGNPVFAWEVLEQFVLGVDYDLHISTDLDDWVPIPSNHYTIQQSAAGSRIRLELTLTHDYGDHVFLRLVEP